jgi:phospholipid/cholesterol/gamma-HCH transport system ATP-binding protein
MKPILEFQAVNASAQAPYDVGVQALSFVLEPGGLALVELRSGPVLSPLADLASGVLDPEDGVVLVEGVAWPSRTPDEAAALRGRIGRVFEGPGWVSNLDVDENVTLAARYHQRLEAAEADRLAQALALRLGLPGLPVGRPAHANRQELRRAQWVRALMGPPTLAILEEPMRDLSAEWGTPLLAEVERQRAAGVAFLWLQRPSGAWPLDVLKPTLHFVMESGNIRRT